MRSFSDGLSFLDAAEESPQRDALFWDGARYRYGELAPLIRASQADLAARGAVPGSVVALAANNHLDTFVRIAAILESGMTLLPIHPRLTPAERRVLLDDARPDLVLTEDAALSLSATPHAAEIFERAPGVSSSSQARDAAAPLAILYTSGTTGRPKGAILPREAFLASARASAQNLGWRDEDRWLLLMPLCHVGGLSIVTRCLLARRAVVLLPRFDPHEALRTIAALRVTLVSVVPTMLKALLEADRANLLARARAVLVGGAAAPMPLLEECARRGIQALTTYGLTEACSQVTTQRLQTPPRAEPGAGYPLAGVEIEILDAQGARLPAGEIGQIRVRGLNVMRGYLHGAPVPPEGLETGDLGWLDPEGRLHLAARRTDLLISGGENVYPAEVEQVLESVPGVARALVFGAPDETWGQRVAAALELQPGATLSLGVLSVVLRERLAGHKRPRLLCVVEELPTLPSGKPDRAGAFARLATQLRPLG